MNSSGTYIISFTHTQSSVQLSIAYSYFNTNANTLCFTLDSVNYQQQSASVSSTQLVQVSNKINDGYRFGYNGQEKDNEVAGVGNHNTAEFWEYDTRVGRRWNRDPKPDASESNYNTFGNNPIIFTDALGDTTNYYNSKSGKFLGTVYGNDKYGDKNVAVDDYNKMSSSSNANLKIAISEATKGMKDAKEILAKTKELTQQFANSLEEGLSLISKTVNMQSNIGLMARIGFAEFRGSGTIEQLAGMDITLNRVGVKGFANTLEGVIRQPSQYSSLNSGESNKVYFDDPYSKMYVNDKLSTANHYAWTRTLENAASIILRTNSITQGATLYYSPMSMKPKGSVPKWNFKVLTEVFVPGVDPNHIKMYKNK